MNAFPLAPVSAFLILVVISSGVSGKTIHVDSTVGPGGDGASWHGAFQKLQDALAVAGVKDTIKVAGGVYYPDEGGGATPNSSSETFLVPDQVQLLGGYKPADPSGSRDIATNLTVLSGDITQDDVNVDGNDIAESSSQLSGTNSSNVMTATGSTGKTLLEGFVITAGWDRASSGGGVLVTGGMLEIVHCWFVGNRSAGRGGALHLANSAVEVTNCLFSGNEADARGGAVGTVTGTDSKFTNCFFSGNLSQRGGAINFNDSTDEVTNCTISGNSATSNGGAIQAANGASVTIENTIIWRNHAAGVRNGAGSSIDLIPGASANVSSNSIVENSSGPNPLFVSEINPASAPLTAGNFRLRSGSPAINTGEPGQNGTAVDVAFNPRVQSVTIDLGAYEYVPRIIHVDVGAFGADNGTSWANAFEDLETALAAANTADEVHLANGIYIPPTAGDSFDLKRDVSMYGGYPPGGGVPRDPVLHPVILSGDVGLDDTNIDGNSIAETTGDLGGINCFTVMKAAAGHALGPGNIIDGLIFTAGRANSLAGSGGPNTQGGAVFLEDDYPQFRDCVFSGNEARNGGGALFLNGSNGLLLENDGPVFEGCTFTGNLSLFFGGGAHLEGGRGVFRRCLLKENSGSSGSAVHLGGNGGITEFHETSFLGNTSSASPSAGTIFVGNLTGSTALTNCLIAGNDGYGIAANAPVTVRSSTVAGNKGRPANKIGGSFQVWNTIFWGNELLFQSDGTGSREEFYHCLVEGFEGNTWSPATTRGNLDGTDAGNDPQFVSPLSVASAPAVGGNYRLTISSPVLSQGDNEETPLLLDLAGDPRLSGHTIDMGCYEFPLADVDGDGLSDAYELAHTTPASATALDPNMNLDGDVHTALEEFAFGGNPNVAEGAEELVRMEIGSGVTFAMAIIWTPNPDAIHFVRIVPEHSLDLGLADPWKVFGAKVATASFGGQPGELMVTTQTFLPLPPAQYLRLRAQK